MTLSNKLQRELRLAPLETSGSLRLEARMIWPETPVDNPCTGQTCDALVVKTLA